MCFTLPAQIQRINRGTEIRRKLVIYEIVLFNYVMFIFWWYEKSRRKNAWKMVLIRCATAHSHIVWMCQYMTQKSVVRRLSISDNNEGVSIIRFRGIRFAILYEYNSNNAKNRHSPKRHRHAHEHTSISQRKAAAAGATTRVERKKKWKRKTIKFICNTVVGDDDEILACMCA